MPAPPSDGCARTPSTVDPCPPVGIRSTTSCSAGSYSPTAPVPECHTRRHGEPDRGLRVREQLPHRCAHLPGREHRLVVSAASRLGLRLRRSPGDARERAVARAAGGSGRGEFAELPRRHHGARHQVGGRGRDRRGARLPPGRPRAGRRPRPDGRDAANRGHQRGGPTPAVPAPEVRLFPGRAVGPADRVGRAPGTPRPGRPGCRRGPRRAPRRGRRRAPREPHRGGRGDDRPRAHLVPLTRAGPPAGWTSTRHWRRPAAGGRTGPTGSSTTGRTGTRSCGRSCCCGR